ncbi:MAG: DUF1934 domain-containing protein [Clostridia bacterium]|nr:DUF1934 domain-containing protein [Clostridia bacterium]
MRSIKKRFAKAKIISRVTQFEEDGSASFTDKESVSGNTECTTLTTDCTVADKGGRLEIEYEESEITGMEGSKTKVIVDKDNPSLVSILREGAVSTALVFEAGKRHHCVYETPYFPIELCVNTLSLENKLTYEGGYFTAEYLVEMNGMLAEKTHITVTIL